MNSGFYLKFENKFRGSTEQVLNRLKSYDGILNDIILNIDSPKLLDIGSGRGEWISKCSDLGIDTIGIDLNEDMGNFDQEKSINVIYGDALNIISKFEDNSFDLITSFHMIEHLNNKYISKLLIECKRILTKNGLLIIETPSIDNLVVSTNIFYLDPTHVNHINPTQLKFTLEYLGFDNAEYFYINGGPLQDTDNGRLTRVFNGVAQDVVCLATKSKLATEMLNSKRSTWRETLINGISTLEAASEYDIEILKKEQFLISRLKEQELAIYNLRQQILLLEKNYEIIMVLLNTIKINLLVKLIKRLKKILLQLINKSISIINSLFKIIPTSLIKLLFSNKIILYALSILIFFLKKIKLYSLVKKIEKKYFQKVEIDQLSKQNNHFLLDYYSSNINSKTDPQSSSSQRRN